MMSPARKLPSVIRCAPRFSPPSGDAKHYAADAAAALVAALRDLARWADHRALISIWMGADLCSPSALPTPAESFLVFAPSGPQAFARS